MHTVHIYIHVCIYIHTYIYTHTPYIYTFIHTHTHTHTQVGCTFEGCEAKVQRRDEATHASGCWSAPCPNSLLVNSTVWNVVHI